MSYIRYLGISKKVLDTPVDDKLDVKIQELLNEKSTLTFTEAKKIVLEGLLNRWV